MSEIAQYGSDDIRVAVGLEHPRMHAGMYGFDTSSQQGLFQIFKEVIDNAVDEATITPDRIHTIDITFIKKKNNYQVIIEDTGRGVPLDRVAIAFSQLGVSAKWGDAYTASIGIYGVGVKATAALSRRFVAVSRREEGISTVVLHKGVVVDSRISKRQVNDKSLYGTTVLFEPDETIMSGITDFFLPGKGYDLCLDLLNFLSVFIKNVKFRIWSGSTAIQDKQLVDTPISVLSTLKSAKSIITFETAFGMSPVQHVIHTYGLTDKLIWQSSPFERELVKGKDADNVGYYVEFFLTKNFEKRSGAIIAAVNMTKILDKSSVHIAGFIEVVKKKLMTFITDTDIGAFFETAYNLPMNAIIMAKCHKATFIGQDKNRFTDREFLSRYVHCLTEDFKKKGNDYWAELYALIEDDIAEKYLKYCDKDYKVSGLKNLAFGLNNPLAYVGCRSKDNRVTELFITEGNSAGGSVAQVVNKNTQAVFKLCGVPMNPFKHDVRKLKADKIFQDLVKVIGVTPNDKSLDNSNFNKIVILTDADSAGYHIAALMVGMLHKINPLILSSGMVLIANPPLYVLAVKNTTLFARDFKAYRDATITMYETALDISISVNNGMPVPIQGSALRDMCYLIWRIGKVFVDVANKLVIDPLHLEQLVHCVDCLTPGSIDTDTIAERLGLTHCIYLTDSNSLILNVEGIEQIVPLKNLVSEIRAYILPEIEKIVWSHLTFYVTTKYTDHYNNTPRSLVQLYQDFTTLEEIYTVSRMKGLGQMTLSQLQYTCVNPDTRSFTVINTTGDLDRIYRVLGVNTAARKKLVAEQMSSIADDSTPY